MAIAGVASAVEVQTTQPTAALRIVVIEGEDAVNVIQQKTAVAPVIEVRDRNDQPVAGAVVNFAIRSGRATFGGARTLTVTTNAAGRAVAAGFAPTGSGALQVSATAVFQGQTAAAVTITQTTVQTAAQAAALSGAGAGGSSGGSAGTAAGASGGGGISGTTIGIVGAAVGGGALVAAKAASDESSPANQNCTFTLSPASINFPSASAAVTITVTLDNPGCTSPSWGVSSSVSVNIISFSTRQGSGTGSVVASITGNTFNTPRTGTISIGAKTIDFIQEASCPFIVSPASFGNVAATGGAFVFTITVASPTCNPDWTASPGTPVSVSSVNPTSSTGNGVVTAIVVPQGPLGGPRPVSISISGQVIAGTQLGS